MLNKKRDPLLLVSGYSSVIFTKLCHHTYVSKSRQEI